MYFYFCDTQQVVFVKRFVANNKVFYFFQLLEAFLDIPIFTFTQHNKVILSMDFLI